MTERTHGHQYTTNGDRYGCPVRGCWWIATGLQAMEGPPRGRTMADLREKFAAGSSREECSNPPEESCADAGCPVHGDDCYWPDEAGLREGT
jgi:hypothetical protein